MDINFFFFNRACGNHQESSNILEPLFYAFTPVIFQNVQLTILYSFTCIRIGKCKKNIHGIS